MMQHRSGSHLKQYQQKYDRSETSAFTPLTPQKKATVALKKNYLIYILGILPHR